jgi:hypothetical protein
MADGDKCGAKTQNGGKCRNPAGFRTEHPNFGNCFKHSGATTNGNKAAARAQVMAMASEADAEPSEVLLKAIRCDWGAVQYVQARLADLNVQILEAESAEDRESAVQQMGLWQQAYGDWVDRSAKRAKMALDAGVQERQIRLSEMIGAQFAMALQGIRQGLNLTPAQEAVWKQLVTTNMLAIDAQLAS